MYVFLLHAIYYNIMIFTKKWGFDRFKHKRFQNVWKQVKSYLTTLSSKIIIYSINTCKISGLGNFWNVKTTLCTRLKNIIFITFSQKVLQACGTWCKPYGNDIKENKGLSAVLLNTELVFTLRASRDFVDGNTLIHKNNKHYNSVKRMNNSNNNQETYYITGGFRSTFRHLQILSKPSHRRGIIYCTNRTPKSVYVFLQ